jgi:hypothetical protein
MGARQRRRRQPTAVEVAYGESLAVASALASSLFDAPPPAAGGNWLVTNGMAAAARWDVASEVCWDHRVFVAGGPFMALATWGASAAGNAARKARAQRLLTAPQWWAVGDVAVEVWSQSFGMNAGSGWFVWDMSSVTAVEPGPGWWWVTVCFADDVPLQLSGPQVPALVVGLVWAAGGVIADPRPAPPLAVACR